MPAHGSPEDVRIKAAIALAGEFAAEARRRDVAAPGAERRGRGRLARVACAETRWRRASLPGCPVVVPLLRRCLRAEAGAMVLPAGDPVFARRGRGPVAGAGPQGAGTPGPRASV